MLGGEHIQTLELIQSEKKNEVIMQQLNEIRERVVVLERIVDDLQNHINSYVCTMLILDESQNPTNHLTNALRELKLFEDKLVRF